MVFIENLLKKHFSLSYTGGKDPARKSEKIFEKTVDRRKFL